MLSAGSRSSTPTNPSITREVAPAGQETAATPCEPLVFLHPAGIASHQLCAHPLRTEVGHDVAARWRSLPQAILLLLLGSTLAWAQAYPNAKTGGNYMHNYLLPPAASSTPWWPTWSPDGQWVAFAMDGSLWRMRVVDGRGNGVAEELLRQATYLSSPEWSPDGRFLAFTADDDGTSINIRVLDLPPGGDGSHERRVRQHRTRVVA